MKKIIFVTNTAGFSKFNAPFMQWLKEQGWRVDNAAPGIEIGEVDHQYNLPIERSPFSMKNIESYQKLKKILDENKYDIIHCHTAVGALLARLAAIKTKKLNRTKILYTAHGFHFFKGSPISYWFTFFLIELLLAPLTNVLVTINEEDFQLGKKYKMGKKIFKIDGVGVNLDKFVPLSREKRIQLRHELFDYKEEDFIILYTAQFIKRKNHKFLINSIPNLIKKIPNLKIVFAGNGETFDECKHLSKELNVEKYIQFLGGRKDINHLCGISDLHVSTSLQEGLATNNIEAMACGLPIVVSDIRGQRDVCKNNENGFLFDLKKPEEMEDSILRLYQDKNLYDRISNFNKVDVQKYSVKREMEIMGKIYIETLES